MGVLYFWRLNCSHIIYIITFGVIISFFDITHTFGQTNETNIVGMEDSFIESQMTDQQIFDSVYLESNKYTEELNDISSSNLSDEAIKTSFWDRYVFDPMRLTLKYEIAYKFIKPREIENNRLSFRLEYSKSLFDNVYLYLDTKLLAFLEKDHRARESVFWVNDKAVETEMAFTGKTRDAYIQTSLKKTSIRAGIQTLVWGESDFALVVDEINPLDCREPLNLNMDELKIGQLMLTVDQYTSFGEWSGFFIPFPKFNELPQPGSRYYPPNGNIQYKKEEQNGNFFEYGVRWKKTVGKSDISFIGASLIDNNYILHMDTTGVIIQSKSRYFLSGMTFNYVKNKILVKGEVALKSRKAYNNEFFQIKKKNSFDSSLGFDYIPNSTTTLSFEAMNYHIIDWNDKITTPKDNYMFLFILSKLFMKDNLSVNWITMYNGAYHKYMNLLSSYYNLNDRVTLFFDVIIPIINNSDFEYLRDLKQVAFKIQYQF